MKKVFIFCLPLLIILIASLFASQKLFNPLFYTSHDGEGHVIRLIEFNKSLSDGQFPVRLAGRVNYGLSYPFFSFNYPLVYYGGELIHKLGYSFIESFKIISFLAVLLGGLSMYCLVKRHFGVFPGIVSSIFYMLAPYTLLNMYVRGDIAESLGLGFFALFLLSIDLFVHSKRHVGFVIFAWTCLILSHNITAAIGSGIGLLFFFMLIMKNRDRKKLLFEFVISGLLVTLLTAFFWVPVVFETTQTKLVQLTEDYTHFFPTLKELIYSPWGFGPFKEGVSPGKMSPQIGIVHSFIFVFSLFVVSFFVLFKKSTPDKNFILFFLIFGIICFFLASPFSLFIWDAFYPLRFVQLPWRLVGYIAISAAICVGYLLFLVKNKNIKYILGILLVALLLYTSRNQIRVNMYVPFHNPFETSLIYGPSTTSKDEHMPRHAPRVFETPPPGNLFASTSGTFKRDIWKSNYHKFTLDLSEGAEFRDNTSYFPGWEVYLDGEKVPVLYKNDEFYRLRITVPEGKHTVEAKFGETWYRLFADIVSLITFCCILIVAVIQCVLWQKQKTKNSKKLLTKSSSAKNAK